MILSVYFSTNKKAKWEKWALLCPTIVVYGWCSLMNFSHPKLLGKEIGLLQHISQTQAAILLSSVTWQIP